ncbi:hypothetical protein [Sinorhizobium fredii]|uniref:hypothetical protein n=1 Tax=Rhizobium fredii TaxID=380 RepID=UPI001F170741|nr:hypothetical protein [Sinorhizobium fredii]
MKHRGELNDFCREMQFAKSNPSDMIVGDCDWDSSAAEEAGLSGNGTSLEARLSNLWEVVAGALSSDPENAHASAAEWMIAQDRS